MEEKNMVGVTEEISEKEYITEKEAKTVRDLFKKYLKSYKEKDDSVSDKEWLEQLFRTELPEFVEEAKKDAEEIVEAIHTFGDNLEAVNEAARKGVSKENWLADKIQEASVGMAVNEYGQVLESIDDMLYMKNQELAEALKRSSDKHIMMSPNLDGNIAENMIAKTTELSGHLLGKDIKVEVLESFTANSVDVRATNLKTGKYQNYQLKFGKDAKATIALIERGNYNNQRIVVPSEQLEEIQEHFKAKGSSKTITDHIDAWGAKGKRFTKEDVKQFQMAAQEDGIMPSMDYSHYQTKELALSIGKNAGVMALQSAVVATGLNVATKVFQGEPVDADEMVAVAIKTGADTSIKLVAAGTLHVAIRKGIIKFLPQMLSSNAIGNIACVGIENAKILYRIAIGELSLTKGMDQMGRTTTSMIAGFIGIAKGSVVGAALTSWIPVVGPALGVATGFVGGMVGYFGGSKIGDFIYSAGKKMSNAYKDIARTASDSLRATGRTVVRGMKSLKKKVSNFFSR